MGDIVQTSEYIAIIRRAEFVDLFKYGWLYLPHSVRLDQSMCAGEGRETFEDLVRWIPVYEYSFEYLLIRFLDSEEDILVRTVHIEQVIAVYAFDERAKYELSISFDPRIKIQVSVWAEWFHEKWRQSFQEQCEQGVVAIWSLFGLSDEDKRVCEETISKEIKDEIFELIFSGRRPEGELSPWIYLFLYERHATYPKDKHKGYFLDYIHTCISIFEKKELGGEFDVRDSGYEVVRLLDMATSDKFSDLQNSIATSGLKNKVDEIAPLYHDTAPLFLYLKSRCAEGFDRWLLDNKRKEWLVNASYKRLALYLLGLTLGYDKVYDAYYDQLPLSIFSDEPKVQKKFKKRTPSLPTQPQVPSQRRIEPMPETNVTDEEIECKPTPDSLPIAWVKPEGKKRLGAKTPIYPVYTPERKKELEESGYKGVLYVSLKKAQFNCQCVRKALQKRGYDAQDEGRSLYSVDLNKHDVEPSEHLLFKYEAI